MTRWSTGARVARLEDPALLTGNGQFVDDIHLPRMLEAAFVRSAHAHANILSIDTAAAHELPGVHAVYTSADLEAVLTSNLIPSGLMSRLAPTTQPVALAAGEVCFVGESVAVVLAESRYVAEDAVALVDVEYEPLPAVSDCREACVADAPRVHIEASTNVLSTFCTEYGDCTCVFGSAEHVIRVSLKQHRGAAHSIETRGIVATYDSHTSETTVWSSTQTPHQLRDALSESLGVDEDQVRVLVPDVGGAFGAKNIVYSEDIVIVAAARLIERPVKWIEDRREHFLAAIQARDQYWDLEAATDAAGRLLGLRGHILHDHGAYTMKGLNVPQNCSIALPGPYVIPNYRIEVTVVETNKVAVVPVRGAGYPQANFAMERTMDRIAHELGLDRAEVRRRNLIQADQFPYERPMKTREGTRNIYESGSFDLCQARAMEAADYAGFAERQSAARGEGRYLGIGIANMVKITGRGPFETALVRVGRSGRVTVYTGAAAMGQGTKTSLAQICADHLGLEPVDVTVVTGDTAGVPHGVGGFGSRQLINAGSALHAAAIEVRNKALEAAAYALEVAEEDLELRGGEVRVNGAPDLSVSFGDIAKALSGAKGYAAPRNTLAGFEAKVDFVPPDVTYGNATHVVEAEVDVDTGAVKLQRYVVVNDSGRLINPIIVEGQLQGGVAHGIGNALFEWMGYDENAQPVTTNFAEYLLPTATEVPNLELHHEETPATNNPLGAKGVGEAGTVAAAAAVISAIEHALAPFDVHIAEAPVFPARLVDLIAASGDYRGG